MILSKLVHRAGKLLRPGLLNYLEQTFDFEQSFSERFSSVFAISMAAEDRKRVKSQGMRLENRKSMVEKKLA